MICRADDVSRRPGAVRRFFAPAVASRTPAACPGPDATASGIAPDCQMPICERGIWTRSRNLRHEAPGHDCRDCPCPCHLRFRRAAPGGEDQDDGPGRTIRTHCIVRTRRHRGLVLRTTMRWRTARPKPIFRFLAVRRTSTHAVDFYASPEDGKGCLSSMCTWINRSWIQDKGTAKRGIRVLLRCEAASSQE